MKSSDRFTLGQLLALCSVMALTPALRLLPGASAALAGRGGWLSVLLALPAAIAYGAFLWHFGQQRREGESLPALWQRAAGERVGAALLMLCGLWLLFYAGFTLRDSAQRLIDTVYPHADRRLFVLPLGLAAAVAGAGEARRLVRCAKMLLPLLVGAIALTLLFALPELHSDNLLPLAGQDALPVLKAVFPLRPADRGGPLSQRRRADRAARHTDGGADGRGDRRLWSRAERTADAALFFPGTESCVLSQPRAH